MTTLLDANVLIALIVADHVHHDAAESWLDSTDGQIASCPITQGSLVRLLVREGHAAATAQAVLTELGRDARHEFWPDSLPLGEVRMDGVVGHRQVTDAYLAQLARAKGARLATFDRGLAALHHDVTDLLSAS